MLVKVTIMPVLKYSTVSLLETKKDKIKQLSDYFITFRN